MVFNPSDFLDIARSIYARGAPSGDEAHIRTAISRAYYAAYLLIRTAIREKRSDPHLQVIHKELCLDLKSCARDTDVQELGQRLDGLRSRRLDADYDLDKRLTVLDAGLMISEAENIIGKVAALARRLEACYRR